MFLPVLFFWAALCRAQDFSAPARELARRIAPGRQDVASLTVRNASSLTAAETAEIARMLESELRVRSNRPGLNVSVTLSENIHSYLWVAETRRGEEREVAMVNVDRPSAAASSGAMSIGKRLLWEQERPILDAAVVDSTMIVLDPMGVALYRERQLAHWLPIPSWKPMPRDPRGRLAVERDTFRAFLPGIVCTGSFSSPNLSCGESNAPWPLGGIAAEPVAGKNYFSAPRLGMFFSAAALPGYLIAAGLDGQARVYDASTRELSRVSGWGSDIAAVESGCRMGAQLLATRRSDYGETDAVQVYEVTDRRATPAGDPATFAGPVVALWPSARKGEAVAVARSLETGRYAAYSLSIDCDR
ncbi:MAG TPA: hypothetical protein VL285_24725 [Bryobacteraceae bacterium]|nr:hypothetical protein [Bryobacteraceae bacterium]